MMKFYKTGEFAKMANVSLRTIRYYDSIGLLRPSKIQDNGYRLYTDDDFIKLQKILTLKYLGFSLDDIFSMTANNSYLSLQDSINMQLKIIKQKITKLQDVENSLNHTKKIINDNQEVEWSSIFKSIKFNEMEKEIIEQYRNESNLSIRIRLHEKYSNNPIAWFPWLYQQYQINENDYILEIGCGNGQLWKENIKKVKSSFHLTLSDISEGMIIDAKENLKSINNITYKVIDCLSIPYPDNHFDIIIANHVMFYINDTKQALKEISRVLKPNGVFYCSAYGNKHMKEITELVKEFDARITLSSINLYDVFGLDNGEALLKPFFNTIQIKKHNDYLLVTDSEDIINYILSCHGNQKEYILKEYHSFYHFINNKWKLNRSFHITKDAGILICKK